MHNMTSVKQIRPYSMVPYDPLQFHTLHRGVPNHNNTTM